MDYSNPDLRWDELGRRLRSRALSKSADVAGTEVPDEPPAVESYPIDGEGGDLVSWTRKKAPRIERSSGAVPYAELHCHSNFSFLDGASHPHELVEEAARLGLTAVALTDHDGLYGAVRFSEAARVSAVRTIFGAELSLELHRSGNGELSAVGRHLVVLARGSEGYRRLSQVIADAHLRGGEKGRPEYHLDEVAATLRDHVLVLTGCRKGLVPAALAADGYDAAQRELTLLVDLFGRASIGVELTAHEESDEFTDALAALATEERLPTVATTNAHYHVPARRRLATVLAAIRSGRTLDDIDGSLPAAAGACLRSGAEMAQRFAAYPGAVARAATFGEELAFDLICLAPRPPTYPVVPGYDEMTWLRKLTMDGAQRRFGAPAKNPQAYARLDHELDMIERFRLAGYFLVVYDTVTFCKELNILCQGRGSAANSAVCYALGITNVDAVRHELLFERFLSPERDRPPDIHVDIEPDRREEVIQHLYAKFGLRHVAQVANIVWYRPRSAVRDIAQALGYPPAQQDAWSKQIDRWRASAADDEVPPQVVALADQLQTFPRSLGAQSGGMVICDQPVADVCPVEWDRMPGRTVLQWDKDDCASVGLVKVDLSGLGILSVLHYAFEMIGSDIDLSTMDLSDPEVFDMLCRADSVGVFQMESRSRTATLGQLKPRTFYDLVISIALIRPGPIQGDSVHTYLRRVNGEEPVCYPHPKLVRTLQRTHGVPVFQEQLMEVAIDLAGFTAAQSDALRREMSSKRSMDRLNRIRARLYDGMASNGVTGALADDLYARLAAVANYGLPEGHAISFAYLVYASAWLKRYHPAAFCAALLNAQPMGFHSPQALVDDARRHGVVVHEPDVNASEANATLAPATRSERRFGGAAASPSNWGVGEPTVRLGLSAIRGISDEMAERIVAERSENGLYNGLGDLVRRVNPTTIQLQALVKGKALTYLGLE